MPICSGLSLARGGAAAIVVVTTGILRGVVTSIFHSSPRFMAGRLRTDDGAHVRFAGPTFVRLDEPVSFRGRWESHPKYGLQFTVESLEATVTLDPDGLASFLANHPEIHGIGPVRARRIADAFGSDFDRVIRTDSAAVARAVKVPRETALNLQAIWIKTADLNATMTYLSRFGLTHFQIISLVEKFGNQIVPMLEEDPYLLRGEIPGFGFHRIDKIARQLGTSKNVPSRLRAGIVHAVDEGLDDGHCWVERDDLLARADRLLVLDDLDSRTRIEAQINALVANGVLVCRSFQQEVIARPDIESMEADLAEVFRRSHLPNPHAQALSPISISALNADQQEAVGNALRHSISLITGGAGSGKTFTIDAIVRLCDRAGLRCVLAAPTGKATKRVEQTTGRNAQTIHRLLGFDGHKFAKSAHNKIEADFIVVDELSMIDVPLAYQLFQAIDLAHTAVLLVGDHNQLPPVGPGNVLRDLITSRCVSTVILNQIFRQAGPLKQNSAAVLKGIVAPTGVRSNASAAPWYVIDTHGDQLDIQEILQRLFKEVLSEKLGFDLIRDVQVLTPVHKGPLGTIELNNVLQRVIHEKLYGTAIPDGVGTIHAGDKVIQTRNDYELGIMNGSLGLVREAEPGGAFRADFEGREVQIPAETGRRDLQLAYATSVHKMQGSEFPCAIVIVHKSHARMHHRNLLYTAVTRAQQTAIILGDAWAIKNCARKEQVNQRNTFLSLYLPRGGELR
jgi:exodeoxyribonuclease V alpha subunit